MAGAGASAADIMAVIGADEPGAVYAILKRYDITLVPKNGSQVASVVVMSRQALSVIERIASERDSNAADVLTRLIEECAARPFMTMNLVDGIEAP